MPDYFKPPKEDKKKGPDYFKPEPTTKISHKHEKDVAARSGGRTVPGSGNIKGKPGDVRDATYLRECKATHGGGTQIEAKWLKKISLEALVTNQIPLLELRFEAQVPPCSKDWIMLPALEFQALLEKIALLEKKS